MKKSIAAKIHKRLVLKGWLDGWMDGRAGVIVAKMQKKPCSKNAKKSSAGGLDGWVRVWMDGRMVEPV